MPWYLRVGQRDFREMLMTNKIYSIINDGHLQAFALMTQPIPKIQHLEYLAVSSKIQGCGYGKKLLGRVCENTTTTLDCEAHLIPYYEKNGFRCTQRNIYYLGRFLYIMFKGRKLSQRTLNTLIQNLLQVYAECDEKEIHISNANNGKYDQIKNKREIVNISMSALKKPP